MKLNNSKANPEDVISEIKRLEDKIGNEVVFCGYGEPMLELESLKKIASFIKNNYPNVKIRVNTNGHANLVHKRDVISELVGLVDSFSVSLNASNAEQYKQVTQCCFDAEVGFNGMQQFVKSAVVNGIKTYVSVVVGYENLDININECEKIATSLGAILRVREYLNEGYS